MNWTIRLFWNGREVLNGCATAVCAYDTARDFMAGNFAGVEHAAWVAEHFGPGSRTLDAIRANFTVTKVYRDNTGVAQVDIAPRPAI